MQVSQPSQILSLQGAATANGNGLVADISGITGAIQVEVAETGGGTCTLALQGSFDGTNWYSIGFQRVDAQATLTRAASNLSVTANLRAVYQILDPFPNLRAVVSAVAGGANVTVKAYCVAA